MKSFKWCYCVWCWEFNVYKEIIIVLFNLFVFYDLLVFVGKLDNMKVKLFGEVNMEI